MKRTATYRNMIDYYDQVDELPADALTVRQYAEQRDCTTSYIYHLIKRGKADFKIVVYNGINFVVKENKKS